MKNLRHPKLPAILLAAAWASMSTTSVAQAPNDLSLTAGKSLVVNSAEAIERVAIGFGDIAEATAVGLHEVLLSGKAAGSTSLIIWQQGGGKLFFDVNVRPNQFLANDRLDNVRREIARELPGQSIQLTFENESVFLRGTAKDMTSVDRAASIAGTLGKVVNLLYVEVPAAEPQILLRVRFASVDRNASSQIGFNLFSTGAANTVGSVTTQQFSPPVLPQNPQPNNMVTPFAFTDLLNVFLYRKDLNLGATIKALEAKGLLQVLAEPNVLAHNGKQASFLAGGEFPYPILQGAGGGGSGSNAITIQFREFGVRLNFLPTITPRGTLRLQVAPEVSSLDFGNGLLINGFSIPALTTRKVKTDVELEEGQSFAIGGLLDKQVTETLERVPFISQIPVLGKFFQSRSTSRRNAELVVIVTPEFVRAVPAGQTIPGLEYPKPFLESSPESAVRTPGTSVTGPAAPVLPQKSIPVETMIQNLQLEKTAELDSGNGGGVGAQQEKLYDRNSLLDGAKK